MGRKRKHDVSANHDSWQLDEQSCGVVQELYQRKFSYSKSTKKLCPLNSHASHQMAPLWSCDPLTSMKNKINTLKESLSNKDIIQWHEHTGSRSLAGGVISEVKRRCHPELCTQAWCKFYEIACSYPVVDLEADVLNSYHLCEAPGAFISSLNHYLVSNGFEGHWTCRGNTLNPYYESNSLEEMIDDDSLVKNTLLQWNFGSDGTGNIMDWDNINSIMEDAQAMGHIQLVTADGSFNCQNSPAEQEVVVSPLQYYEVYTSLQILAPGGAFILKLFTMYETSTICLMCLLTSMFDQVHIFKPVTSKGGNSEVYAVCLGYIGKHKAQDGIAIIKTYLCGDMTSSCLFSLYDLPSSFLDEHVACCETFSNHQYSAIEDNLEAYARSNEENMANFDLMRSYCTELFLSQYHLRHIPKCRKLVTQKQKHVPNHYFSERIEGTSEADPKGLKGRLEGTFEDRRRQMALPWAQRVFNIRVYKCDITKPIVLSQCPIPLTVGDVSSWKVTSGRSIHTVHSSRFCSGRIIKQMNEIIQNAEILSHQSQNVNDSQELAIIESILCENTKIRGCSTVYMLPDHVVQNAAVLKKIGERLENINFLEINMPAKVPVGSTLFITVVSPDSSPGQEELSCRGHMVSQVDAALKVMSPQSSLVVQMSSSLTRFVSSIVWILHQLFEQVALVTSPAGVTLRQLLVCDNYLYTHDPDDSLRSHIQARLTNVSKKMMSPEDSSEVLEFIPIQQLLQDLSFNKFLTDANEQLLMSFCNSVLEAEKAAVLKDS